MAHILNRKSRAFVILLSSLVASLALSGCSESPRQQANQDIESANEEISAHNELYGEARATYEEARGSTQEQSEGTTQSRSVSDARQTMQEARSRLQQARDEISGIRDLDVSEELMEYSRTLDGALEAQIRAEQREIDFYELAEEDPALEDNRERAIGILDEAENAYEEAEEGYEEAAEIGNSNPQMAAPDSD
ncbi:MAG: hypothetical protein L0G70_03460 [Rubrobacter sp.]|nr:hypothetical protein [Rubrobacter sp.]